ncbi:MAG: right-handed parallel beta-helix repeat-containing protein [Deinococcus sp.]|nr:right-handed parallel beta-helix repeat-containing protein [Deinococcus sp.]
MGSGTHGSRMAAALLVALVAVASGAAEPVTLLVNDASDPGNTRDMRLSLREALQQASSDAAPTVIRFDPRAFPPAQPVLIRIGRSAELPALSGQEDVLDGAEAGVIIDGNRFPVDGDENGLTITGRLEIRNLTVQGFPAGCVAVQDGGSVVLSDVTITDCGTGVLVYSGASARLGTGVAITNSALGLGVTDAGSSATVIGATIGDNDTGVGIVAGGLVTVGGGTVVVGNLDDGIFVQDAGSRLVVGEATITSNGISAVLEGTAQPFAGIFVALGATLELGEGALVSENFGDGVAALDQGSRLVVAGARLANNDLTGLFVSFGAQAEVRPGTEVSGNGDAGLFLQEMGSAVTVAGATITGNRFGLFAGFGAELTLGEETVVEGSAEAGVTVQDSATVRVSGAVLRDNGSDGLTVLSGSSANVQGNTITGNAQDGVNIEGEGTQAILVGNSITGNELGVLVAFGATGKLRDNTISTNSGGGVLVKDAGTSAELRDNTIRNNGSSSGEADGVFVGRAARAVLGPGNIISGNQGDGVEVSGEGTLATITGNSISANSGQAIAFTGGLEPVPSPTLTALEGRTVRGTALAGATIELFADPKTKEPPCWAAPPPVPTAASACAWTGVCPGAT